MLTALPATADSLFATAAASSGFLGWRAADAPMLICLPVLLVLSGFFSGSETALFGLSEPERLRFRETRTLAGRAIETLLADPRMLLITLLLGNMTANVLYFVISSVLMLRSTAGAAGAAGLALVFLLLMILLGEVGPKMIASAARAQFASACGPPLLTVHRLIGPLRTVLCHGVVAPLSRLTAPAAAPPDLDDAELADLVRVSGQEGVNDPEEQRILRDVLGMRRRRVRDVMTPRVRMVAVGRDATRAEVEALTREHRLTKIPVYGKDIDHIVGVLHVKRFLLEPHVASVTDPRVMTATRFTPGLATLDQLLDHLRQWRTKSAIVVDEYGGTEGLVSVEDVVEEFVGDIVGADEVGPAPPTPIGDGRWRVSGALAVEALAAAFGIEPPSTTAATVAVLIAERLGRAPAEGDVVEVDGLTLEVETVEHTQVAWAIAIPSIAPGAIAPESADGPEEGR